MVGFAGHEPLFVGEDPLRLERHFRVLSNIAFHYGRCWPLDLALWDLAGEPVPELVRGAHLAGSHLERFARSYPVAEPRSLWAAGWLARLDGKLQRADDLWRRSHDAAERLQLPYDQARAQAALAGVAAEPSASEHRRRSRALMAGMGARPALLHLHPSSGGLTPG
jgi:hypothetical protein